MVKQGKVDMVVKMVAQLSVEKASRVFEKLLRNGAKIDLQSTYMADISEITAEVNKTEQKVVGAYVDLTGEGAFKFLFLVEETDIFILTDLILRKPIGTMKNFDKYTYSTVQEIGNILASAIAGVFSADFKVKLSPSPPQVVHDFAGTVFGEYIMGADSTSEDILIIESVLKVITYNLRCKMFVIPCRGSEDILNNINISS